MKLLNVRNKDASPEWYTPPEIVHALGEFDLDPCFPLEPIYQTAKKTFNKIDDGLAQSWAGRIWLNPPFGNVAIKWVERMSEHNDGVALLFARTETEMFQRFVFPIASSILFLNKRIHFLRPDGTRAKQNCGAPPVLIAYNGYNSDRLADSGLPGFHFPTRERLVVVGFTKSWRLVILSIGGVHTVEDIYKRVEDLAPAKVRANKNYKAKIRQVLQLYFYRVKPATYEIK